MKRKPKFESKRADGGGHWPKGARRHDAVTCQGKPVNHWLKTIRTFCERRFGAAAALARCMEVSRAQVHYWLTGRDWPSQVRLEQMVEWYQAQPKR